MLALAPTILAFGVVVSGLGTAEGAHAAPTLAPSFADDAAVDGARPARDVRRALASATPALRACIKSTAAQGGNSASDDGYDDEPAVEPAVEPADIASADLFVDIEILAAGFVDRAAVFASSPNAGAVVDEPCVTTTLRSLSLADRGLEPPTHVVVRLAVRPPGTLPPAGTGPASIADAIADRRDQITLCVANARRDEKVDIAGSVIARLRFDQSGVREVDASQGSLPSAAARKCIATALQNVQLPRGAVPNDAVIDVAWPLFFAKPAGLTDKRRDASVWESPTLFHFLGCGGAFPTR